MPAKKIQPDKPRPANLAHAAKMDAVRMRRDAVLARRDEIFELYMAGHGFKPIVEMLGIHESPHYVRFVLRAEANKEYLEAHTARAHSLVEEAVDTARLGRALGDAAGLRVAADTFLKVAGKLAPSQYGDKSQVELSGRDGGPVKLIASNMTDEQLAEIAARGAMEAGE